MQLFGIYERTAGYSKGRFKKESPAGKISNTMDGE
jgi:hypothetical protein